jgi:hypothetical protein
MAAWLRRNKFPSGYQVLCHNCNFSKGHVGICPHEKERQYAQWRKEYGLDEMAESAVRYQ